MATVTELKSVVKDTLEKRGVLGQIKARIRTEVFNALDDRSEPRPQLSHENLLINELIREYLEFNKYRYTASVLSAESGQPDLPLDRQFMVDELNIVEDTNGRTIPLLYGILSTFLQRKKEVCVNPATSKISTSPFPRRNLRDDNDRREMDDRQEPALLTGANIGGTFTLKGSQRR